MQSDEAKVWADGVLIDQADATVHILSHGMQRGTTVFDVLRIVETDQGRFVFGLRPHVERFMASMAHMGMEHPYSPAELEDAVIQVAQANPNRVVLKMVAAWADIAATSMPTSLTASVWVTALDAEPTPVTATTKVRAAVGLKAPPETFPPSLKVAASYASGVRERMAAQADGFDDVIFRDRDGNLAEGTTQSLFLIHAYMLVVPPLSTVLDGITRRAVIEAATDQAIRVEVRPVPWAEVLGADEMFLCSTNAPLLSVSQFGDRSLSTDGQVIEQLRRVMSEILGGTHHLSQRWLSPVS